jgi:hypothetical protein
MAFSTFQSSDAEQLPRQQLLANPPEADTLSTTAYTHGARARTHVDACYHLIASLMNTYRSQLLN